MARDESMLHIFLEYVPGGSISAVLQKFGQLSEDATRAYSKQVCCCALLTILLILCCKQILHGLAYLHAHQIMHRGDYSVACNTLNQLLTGW